MSLIRVVEKATGLFPTDGHPHVSKPKNKLFMSYIYKYHQQRLKHVIYFSEKQCIETLHVHM